MDESRSEAGELRVNVGRLRVKAGRADLFGWIVHPRLRIERIGIWLDGRNIAHDVEPLERPDVAAAFPDFPFAERSGFSVQVDFASGEKEGHDLEIAFALTSPANPARRRHFLWSRFEAADPNPPLPSADLMQRIGGSQDYLAMGVRIANDVVAALEHRAPLTSRERILDWGCGSGRVTRHLSRMIDPSRICGCDIDTEAIEWARRHIADVRFEPTAPHPPTPFPDGAFDAVFGVSVMTHLDEALQLAWLDELRRITRPGAVLALTVVGAEMRRNLLPSALAGEFEERGFASHVPYYTDLLRPFSYDGYYKEAFHSPSYVQETWTKFFDVDAYVETGGQDLVVLHRRAD